MQNQSGQDNTPELTQPSNAESSGIPARILFGGFLSFLISSLSYFYFPYISGRSSFFLIDLTLWWHPFLTYISAALRHGQLALWNPYLLCGTPQIAVTVPNFCYLPTLLFAVFNFDTAMALVLLGQQVLAGVGTYLLVECLGWGAEAAVLAGLTYALSGYMFSLQTNMTLQGSSAWFPICFWSLIKIEQASNKKRVAWSLCSSLLLFLLVSSGMPEIFVPALSFFSAFTLFKAWKSQTRDLSTPAMRITAIATACLLSMPAIVPAYEWAKLSIRTVGLPLSEIFDWSAGWYDVCCLFLAQPFGDLQRVGNPFGLIFSTTLGCKAPYIASSFISPIILTLAIWGAFSPKLKYRWFVLSVLALSIVAALGNNTPMMPFLAEHFKLTMFRYPVKLMIVAIFCLTLLSAFGLNQALKDPKEIKTANIVALVFWLLIAWLAWTFYSGQFSHSGIFGNKDILAGYRVAAGQLLGKSAFEASGIGLVVCLLGLLIKRGLRPALFVLLIAVLQSYLLLSHALTYSCHPGPADYYQKPIFLSEQIHALEGQKDRFVRVAVPHSLLPCPEELLDPQNRTASANEFERQLQMPLTNIEGKLGSTLSYVMGQTVDNYKLNQWVLSEYFNNKNELPLSRFCQLSATKYIYTPINDLSKNCSPVEKLSPKYFENVFEDKQKNLRIYKVLEVLPRAYFAKTIKWGKPHSAVVDFIGGGGLDPNTLTLLEHNKNSLEERTPIHGTGSGQSKLSLLDIDSDHVQIDTDTTNDNYLILADEYYPGWKASIDGKVTDILRANAIMRAVYVPTGKHRITFNYQPDSLNLGLILCGLGFLSLTAMVIFIALPKSGAD